MITVGRSSTEVRLPPAERRRLRAEFAERHAFRLPSLLEAELLEEIQREIDRAEFHERVHPGVGVELCMPRAGAHLALELVLNDRAFVDVIEDLTGAGHIGSFGGRLYKLTPGSGHGDDWHGDVTEHRLVGMSVNLGRAPYRGGLLALREAATKRVVAELPNTGAGDALVFRIDARLEHRVTEVLGTIPKIAFAGWFHAEPEFAVLLRRGARGV
jgi:hypothetical protein